MDKDTAITLFAGFERQTFDYENFNAPEEEWADENTPPVEKLPTFDVRLDANINQEEERDFRLRLEIASLAPTPTALAGIAEQAEEADVSVAVQNRGIELA